MITQATAPRRHWSQWFWPLLLGTIIVFASGQSQVAAPGIQHIDKVDHFAVFGLLASLICRMRPGWRWALWALVATSTFGALDEWHQSFTPGRSVEFDDWLADTLGAALAVTLYSAWPFYRRLLEMPLHRQKAQVGLSEAPGTTKAP